MARVLKKSWLLEYSEALERISEAPHSFNIWAAISVVGAVMKNNVYYPRSTFMIYPNNYIVLVGPPGIGKGSAIRPAYELVEELNLANLISDRITAPRIIEKIANGTPSTQIVGGQAVMQTDCTATLISLELPVLLTGSDWMIPFLCQAWDQDKYTYDTKNKGTNSIKGMCTSLIGGCVPDYIRKLNRDLTGAISGGFTARAIFVFADSQSKKLAWPKPLDSTQQGRKLLQDLKDDLKTIAQLRGAFSFAPDAALEFEKFYTKLGPRDQDSEVVLHFKSRMHIHVIKTAMIFCAAERDDLIINKLDVVNAVTCMKHVAFNLDKAFRGVGDSDLAEATARVQDVIEKRKLVSKNEILASVYRQVNSENLDRVLDTLVNISFCKTKILNGIRFYEFVQQSTLIQTNISSLRSGVII